MDVFNLVGAGSTLVLVGLCYRLANDKNGKYVKKEICEVLHKETKTESNAAKNILENKISELKDDILEIKADVKQILRDGK